MESIIKQLCFLTTVIFIVFSRKTNATLGRHGKNVFSKSKENSIYTVIEGDILVRKYSDEIQSAAVKQQKKMWPNAQIPYKISSDYNSEEIKKIIDNIDDFHARTCIRFTPYNGEEDYIYITKGNEFECASVIGRNGSIQKIWLNDRCLNSPGTVKHELMHAVGFTHEQSRTDRDDFVTIHFDNINLEDQTNFQKFSSKHVQLLKTPYDIKSLMHYRWNDFAQDETKPTITAKDGSYIESSEDFSRIDILEMNRLYNCNPNDCWNKTECHDNYEWLYSDNNQLLVARNCGYFGRDIYEAKMSSDECSGLCLSNPHCTHFTWDLETNCYLSTGYSSKDLYSYQGSNCGYVTSRNSNVYWRNWKNGQIKWAPRCDFFGIDFHQSKTGYKECGELCLASPKCTHFTWIWEGDCFLKKLPKVVDIYSLEAAICGYVTRHNSSFTWLDGENGQIKWAKGCDFFGFDFHQEKSKDEECGGICLANPKCTHFTWARNGNCNLKKAPNSTDVYTYKGALCGYVTQRKSTTFIWNDRDNGQVKWARDCDFAGYDFHEQKSKEHECGSICLANPKCNHFTWDKEGNCYLKNAPKFIDVYQYKRAVCGYITQRIS